MRSLTLLIAIAGCDEPVAEPGSEEDNDAFADALASDVEDLAVSFGQAGESAAAMPAPGSRASSEACYPTWGGCQYCFQLDGSPLAGEFTAGIDQPECVATRDGRLADWTYTVSESSLAGGWDGTIAGDYTLTATGSRASHLEMEGVGGETRSYDATWTLDSSEIVTVDAELSTFQLALTYEGFGDRTWDVTVEGTATSATGTATGSDGTSCTATGTPGDVAVTCTPPS